MYSVSNATHEESSQRSFPTVGESVATPENSPGSFFATKQPRSTDSRTPWWCQAYALKKAECEGQVTSA